MKLFRILKNIAGKIYIKEALAVLLLLVAIFFFRDERKELAAIIPQLHAANGVWILVGFLVTVLYILFQAAMYVASFAAVGSKLSWSYAIELFLKRNLLSVFLPAGGVSSLAYTPSRIRKSGLVQVHIHQASAIYAFTGMVTVFVVGIPLLIYTLAGSVSFKNAWAGLFALIAIVVLLLWAAQSLRKKGWIYRFIQKTIPGILPTIDELFSANISTRQTMNAVYLSLGVELTGIAHVFIAMAALGLNGPFVVAAIAYIVSVLLMIVSPFLRGLGAVELSMVYVLSVYGFTPAQSFAITLLYRLFEFWVPLAVGVLAFAWKGRQLFGRLFPAMLVFLLGVVNIISVVTPPIVGRLRILREFIPASSIHASNLMVLFIGLTLIVTAAFLIRGLRNAWILALLFAVVSLIGNLAKALDYEEALLAAFTIVVLMLTMKQYRLRSHPLSIQLSLLMVALVFLSILIFGFVGFYFVNVKHFGVDFTWRQSLIHASKCFILLSDEGVKPITRFGRDFLFMMNALGCIAWCSLLFVMVRPYLHLPKKNTELSSVEKAKYLLEQFGKSPVDHFKVDSDKLFFFSDQYNGFLAYRIANGFAVALEEPVCANEDKVLVLREFDQHCKKMGLKSAFYRVDGSSMAYFNEMKKRKLLIGQEAILDITSFSLEGRDKKSLRNGLNSLQKKGYITFWCSAPHSEILLDELKQVSDEWLQAYEKKEIVFAQGMFDKQSLNEQDIIIIRDAGGRLVSFLNIIPDFSPGECTYDMIRKTADAPTGCMDALIIELIQFAKRNGYKYLNLGLVPMSGIQQPDSTAERVVKYAYEKIRRFRHYQGLREFKAKYASKWTNKYLVYENDFDLLQLPAALNKVMQPA
jgi:phosphatidylglycerol lysyltransferase